MDLRKWFQFMILVLVFSIMANGCGARIPRINVVGSTSVQPIAELLAEQFMKNHRDTSINVQGGGSSAGIKAILDGTAQIGTSSRPLTASELQGGLKTEEIALDGVAIVANPGNKVSGLTMVQLKKIFAGEITNWSQVGGENKPILIVNREAGSGTRGAFTELVMGNAKITTQGLVQGSTGAVRQTVAGNNDAIGYISLAANDPTVKLLIIDNIDCTISNIKAKKYPITRPYLFITKGRETEATKKFINYCLKDGQKLIIENGLVSIR